MPFGGLGAGAIGWEEDVGFCGTFVRELVREELVDAKREKTSGVFRVVLPRTCDGATADPPRVLGTSGLEGAEEFQRSEKASDMADTPNVGFKASSPWMMRSSLC